MNQNKKLWFFVEGYSEENLVLMLMRRYFHNVKICKSPSQFLDENSHACYIYNSKGAGAIPFDIINNIHFIDRANAEKTIVICDVELNHLCLIKKREEIINKAQNEARQKKQILNLENLFFVISVPTIESIYCSEKKIVKEILKSDFEKRKDSLLSPEFQLNILDNDKHNSQTRIKKLFENYGLYYEKRRFSERFFGQLDYNNSTNKIVRRLFKLIQEIWPN